MMKKYLNLIKVLLLAIFIVGFSSCENEDDITIDDIKLENLPNISGYPIVETNQTEFFNNSTVITEPVYGEDFYGQDANYTGNEPEYVDNGDVTITDMVTGLMWQKTLDHNGDGNIDYDDKLTYDEILALPDTCTTGGYNDWRVPSIKEQYSLMMFSGMDVSGYEESSTAGLVPFINTEYFGFNYGDTDAGERIIDVQLASTNMSVGSALEMVFGVNFADGRIKGYGTTMMGQAKKFNYLLVRGNITYGQNSYTDNGDGTITDVATGLMWMQDDSQSGMNWKDALSYAENYSFAGYDNWRLPDAKELQSIVDYSRSPQSSSSAAIDPLFNCTQITNEAGEADYPFYWSSTTHASWTIGNEGGWGVYVSFGRAMGNESTEVGLPPEVIGPSNFSLENNNDDSSSINWIDVHGAGAQRSDPKDGDPAEFSSGHGPQGDAVRILNYVRLVRVVE